METVNLKHLLFGLHTLNMISKNKQKLIRSLARKKIREKEKLFLAEGGKTVIEILESGIPVKELYATPDFIEKNGAHTKKAGQLTAVTSDDLKKASLLREPQNCLAVCELPAPAKLPQKINGLSLFLDGIQDPGNLGTIIRTCNWFGVDYLFCSHDTADVYNPKVIQASMGAFCHIPVIYSDFSHIQQIAGNSKTPIFGTFTDGTNIYGSKLPPQALIVLGNEGQGIREEVSAKIQNRLSIPSFYAGTSGAESLNVAVAAAVLCSEFRREAAREIIQNENLG